MHVDGNIETAAAKASPGREVVAQPGEPAAVRDGDHLIQMRIAGDDRRGRRLDDISEVGVGIVPAQRGDDGRREYHVADQPQPDQKDFHYGRASPPSGGFLPAGHGSIVASSMSMTGMSSLMGYTLLH